MGNFIQKPCSPRSLLAKVRETLEAASQSEQGSSSKEEPG
jgi:DNA-binding response OmpR family regulator